MKQIKLAKSTGRSQIGPWSASLLIAAGMQTLVLPSLHAETTKCDISDKGITTAVEDGLSMANGVSLNDVDVSTSRGVVTLSGSVDNLLDKERAAKTAENMRGVLDVTNQITVNPVSLPDDDIKKNLEHKKNVHFSPQPTQNKKANNQISPLEGQP